MAATATYVHVRDVDQLRAHVRQRGTSQAYLAAQADMTPARLSQLLTGARATVSVEVACALEDALAVPRGTLFAGADPELAAPYFTPDDAAGGVA